VPPHSQLFEKYPNARRNVCLKMEVAGSSETSVYFYKTTRCHIPEDIKYNIKKKAFVSTATSRMQANQGSWLGRCSSLFIFGRTIVAVMAKTSGTLTKTFRGLLQSLQSTTKSSPTLLKVIIL
jgi:hypothetical protein